MIPGIPGITRLKFPFSNFYVKSNGNWCCTSPTWAEVQFRSSWSPTRRSRVGLQLDRNCTSLELHEVIHHRLQSSPSRPSWSPTRRSILYLNIVKNCQHCQKYQKCPNNQKLSWLSKNVNNGQNCQNSQKLSNSKIVRALKNC